MKGILKPFEALLVDYSLEQRALGTPVTYNLLVAKACELCEEFRHKPFHLQYLCLRRLVNGNNYCRVDSPNKQTTKSQPSVEDGTSFEALPDSSI